MKYRALRDNPLLATLFVTALIVAFAGRAVVLMGAYLFLAICCVLANVHLLKEASVRERNAACLFVLVLTVMLPVSVLRSETSLVHYVVILTSMAAGFLLTRNLVVYRKASQLTLLAAQATVFIYLIVSGIANFPLDNMLPDSSSNGVTSYMVLLQANYCIVNYVLTRKTSLPTALMTLAICIVGYGRGSILAAAALVSLGVAARVWAGGYTRALLALVIVMGGAAAVAIEYGDVISEFVAANTKIGSGLYDAHRAGILTEYLEKLDGVSLWTGGSYEGTSIVTDYNSNPHNSYIRAHYIFGLPYLLLLFLIPIYLVNRAHERRVKAYAACVWAVALFRALTEPVLFPTLFDFYFFAGCFVMSHGTRETEAVAAETRLGLALR